MLAEVQFPFALKGALNPLTYKEAEEFAQQCLNDPSCPDDMRQQAWIIRLHCRKLRLDLKDVDI